MAVVPYKGASRFHCFRQAIHPFIACQLFVLWILVIIVNTQNATESKFNQNITTASENTIEKNDTNSSSNENTIEKNDTNSSSNENTIEKNDTNSSSNSTLSGSVVQAPDNSSSNATTQDTNSSLSNSAANPAFGNASQDTNGSFSNTTVNPVLAQNASQDTNSSFSNTTVNPVLVQNATQDTNNSLALTTPVPEFNITKTNGTGSEQTLPMNYTTTAPFHNVSTDFLANDTTTVSPINQTITNSTNESTALCSGTLNGNRTDHVCGNKTDNEELTTAPTTTTTTSINVTIVTTEPSNNSSSLNETVTTESPKSFNVTAPCSNETCIHGNCTEYPIGQGNGSYCACFKGWSGNKCETDVNECSPNICQNVDWCENYHGSYKCACLSGWTGENCTQDVDECSSSPCGDPNAKCQNVNGSFSCNCKVGFERETNNSTCAAKVLQTFNISQTQVNYGDDELFGPFYVPGGFPVGSKRHFGFYVSINGFITFDRNFSKPSVSDIDSSLLNDYTILAPYWADIDISTGNSTSGLYLLKLPLKDVLNDSDAKLLFDKIKDTLVEKNVSFGNFNPVYIFIATWHKVLPYKADKFTNFQPASFQVILLTDNIQSFAVINYQTVWPISPGLRVNSFYHFSSGQNENWNASKEVPAQRFISLNEDSRVTQTSTSAECISWQHDRNISIPASDSCPCSLSQASADVRFKLDDASFCADSKVWDSSGTKQICCYDSQNNVLYQDPLSFYTNPILSSKLHDRFLDPSFKTDAQVGLKACCSVGSNLCPYYYAVYPLPTCSNYLPADSALLWGDPHIVREDKYEFSFNGLGEYQLLQTNDGNLIVQGRTRKLNSYNVTVFVALAVKFGSEATLEIHLSDPGGSLVVYLDGVQTGNLTGNPLSLKSAYLELQLINNLMVLNFIMSSGGFLQVTASSDRLSLSLSTPGRLLNGSSGLLGLVDHNMINNFTLRNGSILSHQNIRSQDLYDFGQSWLLQSENDSLFNYTLSNCTYATCKDPNFVPIFLPTTLENMKVLMKNWTNPNLTDAENICGQNLACFQDLYITNDSSIATASKTFQENAAQLHKYLSEKPPDLRTLPPFWTVILSEGVFRLNVTVLPDTKDYFVNITVSSSPDLNFSFDQSNKLFQWNITSSVRYMSNIHFNFTAVGSNNLSSFYQPSIVLCPCQQAEQCDYEVSNVTRSFFNKGGQYLIADCSCGNQSGGVFCEKQLSICESCYSNSTCYADSTEKNGCTSCPVGFEGNGIKCYEVDECLSSTTNVCDHKCINSVGSYTCSCEKGYQLVGLGRCRDIDECVEKTDNCKENQYCKDTPGWYFCSCKPGYGGANCSTPVKHVYGGHLVFRATSSESQKWTEDLRQPNSEAFGTLAVLVQDVISYWLQDSGINFIDVAVVDFKLISQSKRKKRNTDNDGSKIDTNFQVNMNQPAIVSDLNQALTKGFKGCTGYCTLGGNEKQISGVITTASKFDDPYDLCLTEQQNDCHPPSTTCSTNANGTWTCHCRTGFQTWDLYTFACIDFDECEANLIEELCGPFRNSTCHNLPGSYNCTCPEGYEWGGVSRKCTLQDACSQDEQSRCKNGGTCINTREDSGFACRCTYGWIGPLCGERDPEAKKMLDLEIGLAAGLGGLCFLLIIIIILICILKRRPKNPSYNNGSYSIPRPAFRPSAEEMSRRDSMNKYTNFNRNTLLDVDDDSPVSGISARTQHYSNPAYAHHEGDDRL